MDPEIRTQYKLQLSKDFDEPTEDGGVINMAMDTLNEHSHSKDDHFGVPRIKITQFKDCT